MAGSAATAWSPPEIHSVTPNQWPATGSPTTVTISGAGFGYSPNLTISGTGILGYTNPCASGSSPSCDSTIVATVTLDANTPAGSVETITVTANGFNPSGFLPVPIQDQSGQATAQATTLAYVPPVPQIWFNGVNVTNNANPTCPGNVACVVIGQRIELTVLIPGGITPTSHLWTRPTGTIVGGYTPTPQSFQNAEVIQIPNAQGCQGLNQNCLTFYWVTPSAPNAPWQVSYAYTHNSQTTQTVTARFNVAGPTGLQVSGTAGAPNINAEPSIGFVPFFNYGIQLTASATNPAGAQGGSFVWVQLVNPYKLTNREGGPYSGPTGVIECIPKSFEADTSPALDNRYPYTSGTTMADSPTVGLEPFYSGDVVAEQQATKSYATHLLWNANLTGSVPVPLGSLTWSWACAAVNTLTPQANGTTWIRSCADPPNSRSVQFSPGSSYPSWRKVVVNGPTEFTCSYK